MQSCSVLVSAATLLPGLYGQNDWPAYGHDSANQKFSPLTQINTGSVSNLLFTTLPLTVEQLVQLYGQRWNVETDLRSLKRTLDLQALRCKSADMIAKELVLALVRYNLVRAMMNAAAEQYQLDPRRLSFSRSQDVVNSALPGLAAAATPGEYQARLRRMLRLIASCKLPDRSRRPSTPREVRGHGCKFSRRKAAASTKH